MILRFKRSLDFPTGSEIVVYFKPILIGLLLDAILFVGSFLVGGGLGMALMATGGAI